MGQMVDNIGALEVVLKLTSSGAHLCFRQVQSLPATVLLVLILPVQINAIPNSLCRTRAGGSAIMVRIEEILGGPPRQHSIMDNVLQRRGECLQPESAGLARHIVSVVLWMVGASLSCRLTLSTCVCVRWFYARRWSDERAVRCQDVIAGERTDNTNIINNATHRVGGVKSVFLFGNAFDALPVCPSISVAVRC